MRLKCRLVLITCIAVLTQGKRPAVATPIAGQVDDFQQGETLGWREGIRSGNQPRVIATGGPGGEADAYLQNRSSGASGPGGKMVFFNQQTSWLGNYIEAGIDAIEADLNNLGLAPLVMRLHFAGAGGDVFTAGFEVLPGTGWKHASFSLAPTALLSTGDIAATLGNVTQLWLIHNPMPSDRSGIPPIDALLGIDNIRATGLPPTGGLPGDYNNNAVVDAADYVIWRSTVGDMGTSLAADGNGNSVIDAGDYNVWRNNFGAQSAAASVAIAIVPEAPTQVLLCLALAVAFVAYAPRRGGCDDRSLIFRARFC
jgi:hypothetical protein